jgi:hypothetical protein
MCWFLVVYGFDKSTEYRVHGLEVARRCYSGEEVEKAL